MGTLEFVFIAIMACVCSGAAGYAFAAWQFKCMIRKNHERLMRDLEKQKSFSYWPARDGD